MIIEIHAEGLNCRESHNCFKNLDVLKVNSTNCHSNSLTHSFIILSLITKAYFTLKLIIILRLMPLYAYKEIIYSGAILLKSDNDKCHHLVICICQPCLSTNLLTHCLKVCDDIEA